MFEMLICGIIASYRTQMCYLIKKMAKYLLNENRKDKLKTNKNGRDWNMPNNYNKIEIENCKQMTECQKKKT